MQRHHILPRQIIRQRCFSPILTAIGPERLCYDDFRTNGVLLPATESEAMAWALPLHRGPHRAYNDLVGERFGQIEARWAARRTREPEQALDEAIMRLRLLQQALRRRLLDGGRQPFLLNRSDPLGKGLDFAELDAMAEWLFAASAPVALAGEGGS